MLRTFLVLSLAWLALTAPAAAAEPTTKILLIGKDRDLAAETHEYMADCEILAKCLRQTKGVEAVVSNGWPKDAAVLKDVKAFVIFAPRGGNILFEGPHRKKAEEMLKSGVGLVAIHSGIEGDQGEIGELLLNALGGWYNSESKSLVRNAKIKQFDGEHPICRGWEQFLLRDEYFTNLRFRREAEIVLKTDIDGAEQVVAWTYERPESNKGRSFGFVAGHFHGSFGEEGFRRCLVNAALWTAKRDIPKTGAPCALGARDMELPPERKPK